MASKSITVERLEDGRVSVRKGSWYDVYPEEQREPWAAWYDRMCEEYGYVGYREMAEALRALPPVLREFSLPPTSDGNSHRRLRSTGALAR